ncbi:MAG: TonB-dependent receptor [Proteobacteria bacterium]|nr:TonB-dependent receptor [Pseudomonadota bacterium]
MTASVKSVTGSQKLHSCQGGHILFFLVGLISSSLSFAEIESAESQFLEIQPEIICRFQRQPADSLCPKLSHLYLNVQWKLSDRLSLNLGWDPGHSPKPTWRDSYNVYGQVLPPQASWFSRYALRWQFNPELELSFENWSSTSLIPDASGLSFAQALQDSGWDQSVMRLTLIKPEWKLPALSLIGGLSEGARRENRDAKPYLGILARLQVASALELQAGSSYDDDSLAPDALFWLNTDERQKASQGFQAKRSAISLILDGHHPFARGLRMAIGEQHSHIRGPSPKEGHSPKLISRLDGPLDPTEFLTEPFGTQSQVNRRTRSLSVSYLLLAEYLMAFHHQTLDVDAGNMESLTSCAGIDSQGNCIGPTKPESRLHADEDTFWRPG